MAEKAIGGAQNYILPLDNLDLTFLSKYTNSPKEKKQLWSKDKLDGVTEYYQVEIASQEVLEDDSYTEAAPTYKCHICNIDVPSIFSKEHNTSEKHTTYKKICENVLLRVSKQINQTSPDNIEENQNVYYCVPCSKVVNIKNKYKHESSDYHTKSLNQHDILNDFYKINIKQSNEGKETQKNETKNSIVTKRESDNVVKENFENFATKSNGENQATNSVTNKDVSVTVKLNGEHKNDSFETYLREMMAKYQIQVDVPQVEGDYIYLVTRNGQCKMHKTHFHSFQISFNSIFCRMCIFCFDTDAQYTHMTSEEHVRNILKPIDENFARKIDKDKMHCLLCNIMFLTSENHSLSETHKTALNNSTISTIAQKKPTVQIGKTHCLFCDIHIDSHNFESHMNSKKHKFQETSKLEKEKISKISDNNYMCIICNVLFDGMYSTLDNHMKSDNHIAKKLESIAAENPEFCDICNVHVPKGGMEAHSAENPHTMKLILKMNNDLKNDLLTLKAHFETMSESSNNSVATVQTTVKNEITPNGASSSNTNLTNDRAKIDGYYKLLVYTDATKKKVKCTICNVPIFNVECNIVEHMEGRNHEKAYNNKIKQCYRFMRLIDDSKKEVKCRVCDVIVPNVERNIIQHVEGKLHKQDENDLLDFHEINVVDNKYFCDVCSCYIADFFEHINTDEHTDKYQNEFEIDKSLLRKFVYDDNVNNCQAIRYRELYTNLRRANEIVKINDSKYYCDICEVELGRYNEIDHMLGLRHKQNKEEDSD